MDFVIVVVCLEAALNLVLWGALYHKVNGLPLSVWKVAQRTRVADETRALDVLQAAAASRIGGLVIAVRAYHEQLGGIVQAQLAEAEVRARVSERRSSEAGLALAAASELVRDLRTLAEDLPSLFDRRAMQTGLAIGAVTARGDERHPEERVTVEWPRVTDAPEALRTPGCPAPVSRQRPLTAPPEPADEDAVSGDEELTVVQNHPLSGTALSGVRTLTSAGTQDGAS